MALIWVYRVELLHDGRSEFGIAARTIGLARRKAVQETTRGFYEAQIYHLRGDGSCELIATYRNGKEVGHVDTD